MVQIVYGSFCHLFKEINVFNDIQFYMAMVLPSHLCKNFKKSQEKKYSTIWTVFHFVMFNIIIQLSMVTLSFLLFKISTLKQFMLISGGIIPYCLYLFLKVSEINPNQEVFFCCSPFPVSSAKRNWVVALLFIWFST